mgnify:CR=1 FL=1
MICSIYKLTFEPTVGTAIVLADYESDLLSEPSFSGAQEVEVVPLMRATHASTFTRGNVSRVCEFVRVYDLPTANEARLFELDHSSIMDVMPAGRLKIEVKGQATRWLENAALTGAPDLKDLSTLRSTQIAFAYTVTGGEDRHGVTEW